MKAALGIAFFLCCYLFAGTQDYKIQAAADEARHKAAVHEARIWSKRCEAKGMDVLAVKSDNKPWTVRCVAKRTLKV